MAMTREQRNKSRRDRRIETQESTYRVVRSRIMSIYSDAAQYHSTAMEIAEEIGRLRASPSWKRLPDHYRMRLVGVEDTMKDLHYRHVLKWTVVWKGRRYYGWNKELAGRYGEINSTLSDHCYLDREKGQWVPFSHEQREIDRRDKIVSVMD